MRYATLCLASGLAIMLGAGTGTTAEPSMALYPAPSDLQWMGAPPVLPKGAQMAVLSGDPGKAANFIIRLKLPANYVIPAHHHPTQENVAVLSGTLYAGMGDKLDRAASKPFVPGGFAGLPAQMNHFAWTKAPAVIQVEADGPFAFSYVNPADDPSKVR